MSLPPPPGTEPAPPAFTVIGAPEIRAYLDEVPGARQACTEVVREAYLTHRAGRSSLPHSSFLRLPGHARDRIIALPAYLGAKRCDEIDGSDDGIAGIKWIASWPGNTARGLPRASALLLLNDANTGFPYACLESSLISATRTAASAVLGAQLLAGGRVPARIGFVGAGLIAEHVRLFFRDLAWPMFSVVVFDSAPAAAASFTDRLRADGAAHGDPEVRVADAVGEVFAQCDIVIVATVAATPHLHDPELLANRPIVVHLSLRDLAPELVLAAQNITDDPDHAVREATSLELARDLAGHADFLDGTVGDLAAGTLARDPDRAAIYSPFGLGVLDLAVGRLIHDHVIGAGGGLAVENFFAGIR